MQSACVGVPSHKFCRHLIVVGVVEGAVLQSRCHVDAAAAAAGVTQTVHTHRERSREEGGGAAPTTRSHFQSKHLHVLRRSDVHLITAFSFRTERSSASIKGEF